MLNRKSISFCLCLVITAALSGCAKPEQPMPETPPSALQSAPAAAPEQVKPDQKVKHQPPGIADVQTAVARVYQDKVVLDTSRAQSFIAGDFNGDLSEDIAVVVRPAQGRLEDINHELASWMLGDPLAGVLPQSPVMLAKDSPAPRRVTISEGDLLLAIIHGYGPEGWRDADAQQTYLLRNAVGSRLRAQSAKQLLTLFKGERWPSVKGDVISQTLLGEQGFLYYTGARYAWYDPRRHKQEVARRMVH